MTLCSRLESAASARGGFTLLELLVSTVIGAIIMAILLQCLSQTLTVWTQDKKRSGEMREGRTGLQLLVQDLESIVVLPPATPPAFTAADEASRQRFIVLLPADDYQSAKLAFLHSSMVKRNPGTTVADSGGDVRLVAYAMGLSKNSDGSTSQKLWRKEFASDETWTRIRNHISGGFPLIDPTEWAKFSDPAFGAEPVAYDAVRFEAQPLTSSVVGGTSTWSPATTWDANKVPQLLDLTLRVTNSITALRLTTEADWRGQGAVATKLLGSKLTPTDYSDDPEVRTMTSRLTLNQPDKPLAALP